MSGLLEGLIAFAVLAFTLVVLPFLIALWLVTRRKEGHACPSCRSGVITMGYYGMGGTGLECKSCGWEE